MKLYALLALAFAIVLWDTAAAQKSSQPTVVIDEDQWVVFYDLPSRRFRNIRNNFIQRRFDLAAADLTASATYIAIEAGRSPPAIGTRLSDIADDLLAAADGIDSQTLTVAELDGLFGRAHWLLGQHYLHHARQLRDKRDYRGSGLNLWATTHHLERAVLWSNARIDRRLHKTLEDLRDLAARMQVPERAAQAVSEKPIRKAEALLVELGKVIDRPVVPAPR